MYPPIFTVAAADPGVTALIGSNPVRLYLFGEAPQGVVYPYVAWQSLGGLPENYLGTLPDADSYNTQIDVYADTATSARTVAKALRDAIEPIAYVTSWRGESRDTETKKYRFSFDVAWIVQR
ncbi:TPA: DUF3168 domain-containing protein [Pseudomonas aeruginosa]|uniref:DUF3168 domain-containing protein n=1 Tax=Pseudomonas aeruginosa TaxID=287 RepID=UPI0012DAA5BB|nr:DUF3168 domain-containing protein [Pseudomonas aeruginosa]MDS1043249.1 DUF3168 domain-containing protein [Pseudomonas aeruginosa]MUH87344.1 DUF3168 domain-containing protein [Pseudomonas aeruginosa]HBO3004317.1 DUF3168 domain-containing protein [Pseudomonas aeruginosa]HBO4694674.1 DUF3168 domain-containing protein [Pseudomonas aeruginosa]HCT4762861.1 DUF3168 domain-containing protein [Pseudomonas aeruginosa]